MKMIELQFNRIKTAKPHPVQLGGFELRAPHKYEFSLASNVRKGELSLQFKVEIPKNGLFEIPDTDHNRKRLLETSVVRTKEGEPFEVYTLISEIDLNEEAPHAGGGVISQDEERDLKKEIEELKAKNQKLVEDVIATKASSKPASKPKTGATTDKGKPKDKDLKPDLV